MPTESAPTYRAPLAPNQAAHQLLTYLIERVGLHRRSFLDRLASLGCAFSDDDFVNWGRAKRSFPRDWPALRAMIQIVTEDQPPQRGCTASEALQFLGLVGMPFPELQPIAQFFAPDAFGKALAAYIFPDAPLPQPVEATPTDARVYEERLRRERGYGLAISEGLSALAELLWAPEVREAVVSFRIDFQAACGQIDVLADYKQIHDLFQQLEDRYYLVYHESKRLPIEPSSWGVIERNEPELRAIVDDLLERGAQASVTVDSLLWRQRLIQAREKLATAVETGDATLLRHAITLLKDVLGREPSRINTRLVSVASSLRLAALLQALTIVRDTLARRNLQAEALHRFLAFEHGVEALAGLNNRLVHAISTHNAFQEVDDELHRIEALLDQDTSELTYAWQNLRPMMQHLCSDNSAVWSVKLGTMGVELESALLQQSATRTIRLFRSYRSQASRIFNQVDRNLLALCEELRQVGEPLAAVLRMIA